MFNEVDAAIAAIVTGEPRVKQRDIAARVGVTESTVRSRLQRLIETGALKPTIQVHPSLEQTRLTFMVKIVLREGHRPDAVLEEPEFDDSPWSALQSADGRLFVQLTATDVDHLADRMERVRAVVGVDEASISMVTHIETGPEWGHVRSERGWKAHPRALDNVDRSLIDALRANGRSTYTELSEVVGLTVAATRRRVLRLTDDELIRFATLLAGPISGSEASIELRVGAADVAAVENVLLSMPGIRYVIHQTGPFGLACYAVSSDAAGLGGIAADIRRDPRVRECVVDPFLVLRDSLSWAASAPSAPEIVTGAPIV
jgi:DNA-binding Lrp family transcriptional regulator